MSPSESWKKNAKHQKTLQIFLETDTGKEILEALTELSLAPAYPATNHPDGLIAAAAMRSERVAGHADILRLLRNSTFDAVQASIAEARKRDRAATKSTRKLSEFHPKTPPVIHYPPSEIQ